MYTHVITHNGQSYEVVTPTHADDHHSYDDWVQHSAKYIQMAANIATIAGVALTHKPKR